MRVCHELEDQWSRKGGGRKVGKETGRPKKAPARQEIVFTSLDVTIETGFGKGKGRVGGGY